MCGQINLPANGVYVMRNRMSLQLSNVVGSGVCIFFLIFVVVVLEKNQMLTSDAVVIIVVVS